MSLRMRMIKLKTSSLACKDGRASEIGIKCLKIIFQSIRGPIRDPHEFFSRIKALIRFQTSIGYADARAWL
jgi:hypothetical protein